MTRFASLAFVALLAALLVGCNDGANRSNSPTPPTTTTTTTSPAEVNPISASAVPARAECLVCKHDADLACVEVDVDKATPTYAYNGQTYYFCSKECRDRFAKNPQKYLEK